MEGKARKPYPTDPTDEQWELMQIVIPEAKPGGRPRSANMREVINALLYLNRSGCQWDMLPHDLPPKSTVYEYFAAWRDNGTWQQMLDVLREGYREIHAGRAAKAEERQTWLSRLGLVHLAYSQTHIDRGHCSRFFHLR